MFQSKSKMFRKEIEELFNEIQINLENNYKDLAIEARKKAYGRLHELKTAGKLNEKDYGKLEAKMNDYIRRMEGYHH